MRGVINRQLIFILIQIIVVSFLFKVSYLFVMTVVLIPSFIKGVIQSSATKNIVGYKFLFVIFVIIMLWTFALLKYDNLFDYGFS